MFEIVRDPNHHELEKNVLNQLASLVPGDNAAVHSSKTSRQLPSDNRMVSPEDALRELAELEKQLLLQGSNSTDDKL